MLQRKKREFNRIDLLKVKKMFLFSKRHWLYYNEDCKYLLRNSEYNAMVKIIKELHKEKLSYVNKREAYGTPMHIIQDKVKMNKMTFNTLLHKLSPLFINIRATKSHTGAMARFISLNKFGMEIAEETLRREDEFQRSNQPSIQV